jgi:SseB protein N-terminal domain
MSIATDNNAAIRNAAAVTGAAVGQPSEQEQGQGAPASQTAVVEAALGAAISDATRIGDLLDALRTARLWLPLPDYGTCVTESGAVRLPTVTYLGCDFIPAYTSGERLAELAGPQDLPRWPAAGPAVIVPHIVVRAADLARLMPPDVGIALNVGASESIPVYPQGVAFLAADEPTDSRRITVGPVPLPPEELLAGIRRGLAAIPQASAASAGWLSVQFAGEGLVISVTLDDPADPEIRDSVVTMLEQAAYAARHDAGYPIDVTFPGEGEPDHIDRWIATASEPFYLRSSQRAPAT